MQPQEANREPMVELDTGGNAVDVELKAEKEVQVEEQKDNNAEQAKEVVKEVKKDEGRVSLIPEHITQFTGLADIFVEAGGTFRIGAGTTLIADVLGIFK